jgi:radical SAM protein with 4Fe4S-binding SPASM domain
MIDQLEIRPASSLTAIEAAPLVAAAKDRAQLAYDLARHKQGAPWRTFHRWFTEAAGLASGGKPANEQLLLWLRTAQRFEAMSDPSHWPGTYLPAGEICHGRSVVQLFRAPAEHLSAISILIGTYGVTQNSNLTVSLHEVRGWRAALLNILSEGNDAPKPCKSGLMRRLFKFIDRMPTLERLIFPKRLRVGHMQECCDAIPDNSPIELFLAGSRVSRGKLYLLKIASPDATPGKAVTVWLSNGEERIKGHVWCSVGGSNMEKFGLMAEFPLAGPVANSPVPPALLISTTTQCNLNCIHCISRYTRGSVNRLSSDIRLQIRRWADQGLLKKAATDYSGDILWADKRFGHDLDFFLALDVPFELVTNGVCLDRETSYRLMKSRVVCVNVSLDAARDDTYRRIRIGAPPLEEVVNNMRVLSQKRMRAGRMDIRLSVSMSLMRANIDELPEAISLARDAGFDVLFTSHMQAYTADMAHESLWHDKTRFNEAREHAVMLAEKLGLELVIPPPFNFCATRRGHKFCSAPWESAVILGNGDVQACCVPASEMRMGNLNEQTMEEIWNGPRYQQLRERVNSANPPEICNACPIYRKENNPDSYMPFVVDEAQKSRGVRAKIETKASAFKFSSVNVV